VPMAKEKSVNPAAQARKQEKAKALKKSKAQVAAQRAERLAKRNPERLQRQIEDLQNAEKNGGLRPKDRETLNQLERDVKAIRKAREQLGDKAPQFRERHDFGDRGDRGEGRGRGGGVLGKRGRDGKRFDDGHESSDTDEDVANIPMPKDTPPPIPRNDRRPRKGNANDTPMGESRMPHALPAKPVSAEPAAPSKTVYAAAPQLRDFRKEANIFVPAAVKRKLDASKGKGKLLEPEQMDKLEKEGYGYQERKKSLVEESKEGLNLEEEQERFERELRAVEMEEVEDESFAG
ncbi:hypothetical protein K490DRAFT_51803, partial [Saccharata proteae CBS 121410]